MNEGIIPEKIDEEIGRGLDKLKSLKPGTTEYRDTLGTVEQLHKMKLEAEKVELDYQAKREKLQLDAGRADEELRLKEVEEERQQNQAKAERIEFWVKLAADAGILIANLAFFGAQFKKGYKFEANGAYTSTTFKEARQKAFSSLFKRK